VKCEENEKQAEEDALKTILEENECRRKRTFIPAENTQFRVGGHNLPSIHEARRKPDYKFDVFETALNFKIQKSVVNNAQADF